jgi:hypothetical protein
MTQEDQVFIVNVVVINPTWETMTSSVISQLASVIVKLNVIVEIYKHKRFHEGHHFILMAMEVHNTLECDMDHSIKECVCFFHSRRSKNYLSLYFCIQQI